jgi:4-amino-4-deoxy-L-arabinose transferase-like glycosyltransferase
MIHAERRLTQLGYLCLALVLMVRLISLGYPALTDPSEARFAVAAQHMVETGNYVTPYIHQGVEGWKPYWAKPPLHMWLTAISYLSFGYSEFSSRIPGFLSIVLCTGVVVLFGRAVGGSLVGCIAGLLYASFVGVFLFSALSLTDSSLALCITLAYAAVYYAAFRCQEGREIVQRRAYLAAFAALGLGILVKGPVAPALFVVGAGGWVILSRRWTELKKVPWLLGVTVCCGIWMPWYLLAELRTPGFLRYFFLEENLARYLSSSWQIRYGTLHKQPYGAIWLMLLGVTAPWSFGLVVDLCRRSSRQAIVQLVKSDSSSLYLLCWGLAPAVFFTMARQILPTYLFSGLPALAVLVANWLVHQSMRQVQRVPNAPRALPSMRAAGGLASVALVSCLVAVWLTAVHWAILTTVAVLALVVVGASNRHRYGSPVLGLVLVASAITLAYSSLEIAISDPFSRVRSGKKIVAELASDLRDQEATMAVLHSDSHSVRFYATAWLPKLQIITAGEGLPEAIAAHSRYALIKKADLHLLPADALQQMRLLRDAGKWQAYELFPRQ